MGLIEADRCRVAEELIQLHTGRDVRVPIYDPRGCEQCLRDNPEPTVDDPTPTVASWAAAALTEAAETRARDALLQATRRLRGGREPDGSPFTPGDAPARYLTAADLAADTLRLVPQLPPDITAVAGVSRSGLAPATLLAMHLHLPLFVLRHKHRDLLPAGHGWRMRDGQPEREGTLLVVDDTTMRGGSVQETRNILVSMRRPYLTASVYCNPRAEHKPDLWAADLPWPHLLGWNLFNSVLTRSAAVDFDGVLCRDCTPEEDDDGPRYRKFLETAAPLHLVRRAPIPLIVTARLEKYREPTEAWLRKWGVRWKSLVMGPWRSLKERARNDIAAYKADHFAPFAARPCGIKPKLFIESDPRQAVRIAALTGRLVVCPTNAKCYP